MGAKVMDASDWEAYLKSIGGSRFVIPEGKGLLAKPVRPSGIAGTDQPDQDRHPFSGGAFKWRQKYPKAAHFS